MAHGISAHRILILGASYGSLFATKCLMAGHDVTLVCRRATAELINTRGTEVRIRLKGEDTHRAIRSAALPGRHGLAALCRSDCRQWRCW